MDRIWTRIGQVVAKRTVLVLVLVVVITAVLAGGLARLDFATGQDSYIDKNSTEAKDNERYQNLFGGESMVVLFTVPEGGTVVDLFTEENLARFEQLDATLHEPDKGLEAVITPVTALRWTQDLITSGAATRILTGAIAREPDPAAAALRQDDAGLTLARLAAAGEQSFANPAWLRFLLFDNTGFSQGENGQVVPPADAELSIRKPLLTFFPDTTHALAIAIVKGNASLDELATGSDSVKDAVAAQAFEGAEVIVTGTPTFLTDINDYLQKGMLTLGLIAVGVMLVVLAIVFRVRWRLLPLLAVLVGIAWGFGVFGYLGIDLSLVTIAGLPILIGVGVEFAIQIHNRVEEECVLDRETNPFGETARQLGPPMTVATISAVISFLVMRISRVPMIQDFGVLLAVGIVMLLITGIVVPLAVLGARERKRPTTSVRSGVTERILHWLGSLPSAAVVPLVAIAVVIPIAGLVLERDSEIESDPINWADQSTDTIRNARQLEHDVDFATTLGIFIETSGTEANGIFTDQLAAFVHDFVERELTAEGGTLVQASSLVSTVSYLIEVPGTSSLPPTGTDVLEAYTVAPPDIQRLLVGSDGNAAQVLFQVGPSSLEERAGLVERLEVSIAQPGTEDAALPSNAAATPAGLAIVGVGLLNNLTANRVQLTIVALLLVAGWLVFRYGDLARAALTMVPVLLAVGGSATLVSLLGITLSPLTTVGGPLVIATCAEFSALLTGRYVEGRRAGLTPSEATALASERTGRAFIASALTTIGGFAVLMFAALPLLRNFGAVVTLNVSVAVLSALVVVPPLAKWADERGWFPAAVATPHRLDLSRRRLVAAAGGVVLGAIAVFLIADSVRTETAEAVTAMTVPGTEVPATLPPPTTAPPAGAATTVTLVVTGETLPPGPPEKPTGLVAGTFYDTLTGAGVDPGVARCAADTLVGTTPEADLLAMGIASSPRPEAVNDLIAAAALACGVPQATLDELAGA
ncbi:MAG: RND family transporter [Acidimicrobiia bacterium]